MKFFRLLPLAAMLLLTACQSDSLKPIEIPLFHGFQTWSHSSKRVAHSKYTEMTITDAEGELVAIWVAEGELQKVDGGYVIKAVERRLPPPENLVLQYPNGRAAFVSGMNIVLQKVPKPAWLAKLDSEVTIESAPKAPLRL